ncbi:hypothetical protein [Corynebacterium pelargi]|uniref:Uncharacterized protein n=1 Tax=Corynebacterium pelargi TaxID=1471400 RepID=A0A410W8Y5_9CORY|nr:hypothetical protein [Corynebacterium pelargi]QAU52406.1 hypothetical protein CPELA_05675 [Corynebacterium pelargi]GGG67908.1 hypothetical protein GCM10007338_00610 [Corynebacterium pelargi]
MSEKMLPALWFRTVGLVIWAIFCAFQSIWWLFALTVVFLIITAVQLKKAYTHKETSQ